MVNTLPLYEKAALRATQMVNLDPSPEAINALMDTGSAYRAQVSLMNFVVRMLDEDAK